MHLRLVDANLFCNIPTFNEIDTCLNKLLKA